MKKEILVALFAASVMTPAFANETADNCREYASANGTDDSGCDCLGEAAAGDADLAAALAAISSPEDLEAADDATKEAVAVCFPA